MRRVRTQLWLWAATWCQRRALELAAKAGDIETVREIYQALNYTRPEDATIVPAADQGGQNE